jgi:predicted neuraminidase
VHRWTAYVIFLTGLLLAILKAPTIEPTLFVLPAKTAISSLPKEFSAERLPTVTPMAHAGNLAVLDEGRLAAVWYGGLHEGAPDVKIWLTIYDADRGWSTPRIAADPTETARELHVIIRSLGNPVIYASGKRLHLWFVCAAVGGWSSSSIVHKVSENDGRSWSTPEKLTTSPFFNLGTLSRSPPIALTDGGFALPAYHEFFGRRSEYLRISSAGTVLKKIRLPSVSKAFQPAAVAIDRYRGFAVQRSANWKGDLISADATNDGGSTWQLAAPLPITNYDSALALLRLSSGRLLLAANPTPARNVLQLFWSTDDGLHWQPSLVVERDSNLHAEYSYPALAQSADGRIHLLYTFRREAIAHAVFNETTLLIDQR